MSTALRVGVRGIGLLGPGLADWATGHALLHDPSAWQRQPSAVPAPARLPATERRRAGLIVKLAIAVADEAVSAADADPSTLATVFSSASGDPANCHALCEALASPARLVSPTRFTNSVHNAPAGYWHIATRSMQPSTSLAGFDASVAAGLLEAAGQCTTSGRPVLLVACDVPYPQPLGDLRPVADSFGFALVLVPAGGGRALDIGIAADMAATPCTDAGLETLRCTVPAARALPLLQALARPQAATLCLDGTPGMALQLGVGAR